MSDESRFHAFDKEAEVIKSQRNLPHWFQPGTATFVTFRTDDSMPQAALDMWRKQLRIFLQSQGLGDRIGGTQAFVDFPESMQKSFQNYRASLFHRILDKGFGACVLRGPRLSSIVAETLQFYDGSHYDLDRFVVMPNHVHMLASFRKEHDMRQTLENCLHYSALRLNECLGSSGAFWQAEPFEHCVRNEEQFLWIRDYIRQNPKKAKLRLGSYHYWQRST